MSNEQKEEKVILANSIAPLMRASAKFVDITPSGIPNATLNSVVEANIKDDNGPTK